MADTSEISQTLRNLGLDESESSIYLALLQSETLSVLELSQATNIPRTTVYRLSEDLVKKGFLEWVIDSKGNKAKAVRPEFLQHLVLSKQAEADAVEAAVKKLQSQTKNIIQLYPQSQVRYYRGAAGMKQLIWNTLAAKTETVGYSVFGRAKIIGIDFAEKYIREFEARGLADRVLTTPAAAASATEALKTIKNQVVIQNIKLITIPNFYISGDTYIYNNIYAVNFWEGGEVVGVEIENPEIAKIQKSIFEALWAQAEPLDLT